MSVNSIFYKGNEFIPNLIGKSYKTISGKTRIYLADNPLNEEGYITKIKSSFTVSYIFKNSEKLYLGYKYDQYNTGWVEFGTVDEIGGVIPSSIFFRFEVVSHG